MSIDPALHAPLLAPDEPPPYTILNPHGRSRVILVCEHGGRAVPRKLARLGLDDTHFEKHYAYDIGVRRITETLSALLDAPAILANYSRLVVDINRAVTHPTAFPVSGEGAPITGNINMTADDRAQRLAALYDPFHNALNDMVGARIAAGGDVPVLVAIHSFTPVFYGAPRPWEVGVLWVQDDRLPLPMVEWFRQNGFVTGDNEPYDARMLAGSTIHRHADLRNLPNALLEVRNDLIGTDAHSDEWAKIIGDCLQSVLATGDVAGYYQGPQHEFDPEMEHRYFEMLIARARQSQA